ncbi:MAG: TonB-dependent receptor [Acidobacteria bacterium]|nr:TonB-dependent receptor [Acidobacteriota bacterium]
MPHAAAWLLAWLIARQAVPAPVAVEPAIIKGQVVNGRTLSPIADVLVALSETDRSARTSPDGRFAFEDLTPGTYTLTVSTVGYIFVRRPITVSSGSIVDLQVPLAEGTGTYEESVHVTAGPADHTPPTASVALTSSALQDLREMAADDPVRAMQALPGASTGDDFRAEFSVRGSAFRHGGIVVDGTPTNLMFHAMGGLEDPGSIAMINTDVLASASLDVGAHALTHGDWLGPTIAFDLREGSRDRRALRFAVSGTNASVVAEGPLGAGRRGSWLVSVRRSYVDWLVRVLEPDIDATVGFYDGQAKVGYDLTPRQHVEALFIGGRAHYENSTATGANQINHAWSNAMLGSAAWRLTHDRVLVSQRLSFVGNHIDITGRSGQALGVGQTRSLLWRADASFFAAPGWQIDGGLKVERSSTDQTLRAFANAAGVLELRADLPFDRARTIGDGWGQVIRTTSRGRLAMGARVAHDTATGSTGTSPWLVGHHEIGIVHVFGGVSGARQFPALSEMGRAPEPLQAERAWNADLGVAQPISAKTHWRVAAFRRREWNGLRAIEEDRLASGDRIVGSPFTLLASRLDTRASGVELVLERRSETGASGWVGYTWSHARATDTTTGEGFDADFDQRHTFNLFVQQRVSYRVKLFAKLRMGSNFPIVGYFDGSANDLVLGAERNLVRLPVYSRFDIGGRRTFTFRRSRLTMFIEFVNLWNRRNLGPGRGSIRSNLAAIGYAERLLPLVPSGGLLLEF